MAEEAPSNQSPILTRSQSVSDLESTPYWCYNCNKRVAIETLVDLPNDVVCYECKDGFVESISAAALPARAAAVAVAVGDPIDDPTLGNQFIQVLRLIAQAARDNDAPPPPPSDPDEDYLRIELDGWDNVNDDEGGDEEEEEDDDGEHSVEVVHEGEAENGRSDGEDDEEIEVIEPRGEDESEEEVRRRRREVLRLRLNDFASRAASRRNRILDWAEILMGLEDHSIELRLQVPDSDAYIRNPGDYVDAAGYEALLQNLAESDSSGRRGAPPAAKAAVEGLESVIIGKEDHIISCAICKDMVNVGEVANNLLCGHGYHADCIVPWLSSRNSCPVCRYELPTDDMEYEEERKKRNDDVGSRAASSGSSGGVDGGGGSHTYGLE